MTPQKSRIIFMGTPAFSIPTLQALLDGEYDVVAVYTQPPRPSGRGHHVTKSPVHVLAEAYNIPVYTPKTLRCAHEQEAFSALNADVAIVVAYGLILPQPILDAPRLGCVNIHGSILPRWRGAAPIQRALMAGDAQTGVTIMKMDAGLDTGPMIKIAVHDINVDETAADLFITLADLGADTLLKTLPSYLSSESILTNQPEDGATYAHKLSKQDGQLDWRLDAQTLVNHFRGLHPWPGVFMMHDDTPLRILEMKVVESETFYDPYSAVPGTIVDTHLTIACGQNTFIRIMQLQKPGGKPLNASDFLRGYSLPIGTYLLCPAID